MAKSTPPKHLKPPPRCKAILLCEKILTEARIGRSSLIGIIRQFYGVKFPAKTAPMVVFLQLVNGIGQYKITVEVQDLAEDNTIAKTNGPTISFPDRLTVRDLVLRLPSLSLPHAGRYDVIVFANGQEIDRQQFTILTPPGQGETSP